MVFLRQRYCSAGHHQALLHPGGQCSTLLHLPPGAGVAHLHHWTRLPEVLMFFKCALPPAAPPAAQSAAQSATSKPTAATKVYAMLHAKPCFPGPALHRQGCCRGGDQTGMSLLAEYAQLQQTSPSSVADCQK